MAGQTPLNLNFSRQQFLSGSPSADAIPVRLLIYAEGFSGPLYIFENMMIFQVSSEDREKSAFFQASNSSVKLYSFDRGLTTLVINAVVIDAQVQGPNVVKFSHKAYEQFLWLYDNFLKASVGVRGRFRIVVEMAGFEYTGIFTGETDGWASEGEWAVALSLEFLVLQSKRISLPADVTADTSAASKELRQTRS